MGTSWLWDDAADMNPTLCLEYFGAWCRKPAALYSKLGSLDFFSFFGRGVAVVGLYMSGKRSLRNIIGGVEEHRGVCLAFAWRSRV